MFLIFPQNFSTLRLRSVYIRILPFLLIILPLNLQAARIQVSGTWDLNHDGTSELLIFDRTGSPVIKLVEVNQDGSHLPVWTYSVPEDWYGWLTDAHLADVTGDSTPELLATFLSMDPTLDGSPSWLLLFKWNGSGFDDPIPVKDDSEKDLPMRPLSFSVFHALERPYIAVSQSAPSRQVMLMVLDFSEQESRVIPVLPLKPDQLSYGVNPLFSRPVKFGDDTNLAVFGMEPPYFMLDIYNLRSITTPSFEAKIEFRPKTQLLGAETLVRDINGDGKEDLILPMADDRVLIFPLGLDSLELDSTTFSNEGLFQLSAGMTDEAITANFIAKVEAGLFESLNFNTASTDTSAMTIGGSESKYVYQEPVPLDSNAVQIDYPDTLEYGDTLSYSVMTGREGSFYQFRWLDVPLPGAHFDPDSFRIVWIPDSLFSGQATFSFQVDVKRGERLVQSQDLMGQSTIVVPITKPLATQLHAFVQIPEQEIIEPTTPDTAVVETPQREELYSILVITPKKEPEKRYDFDGVPPFSVMVEEIPVEGTKTVLLGHHIAADLSGIQRDKQVSFDYSRTDIPDTAVQTLTLIHDLESNLLTLQLSPPLDTVLQSYQPGLVDPKLSAFPNYFFQGFPAGFSTDSLAKNLSFPFTDSTTTTPTTASISLTSPTIPPHTIQLFFDGGDLLAIRGQIKVRDNGTKKTITEVDVTPAFHPLLINARLKGYMPKPMESAPMDTTVTTLMDTTAIDSLNQDVTPNVPEKTIPDSTLQSMMNFTPPDPGTFLKRDNTGFFLTLSRDPLIK